MQSRLSVLEHFECIADRCPDNCCHGWSIPVDDEIYKRWQTLDDSSVKQAIQISINYKQSGNSEQPAENKLVQQANGDCTHLSPEGLCYLQQQLGHDYLPRTCREFPRVQVGSEAVHTDSAYLSCPEIARLVVTEKNMKTLFSDTKLSASCSNTLEQVIYALEKLSGKLLPIQTVSAGISLFYLSSRVLELMDALQQGTQFSVLLTKMANTTSKSVSKQLKLLDSAQQAGKLQTNQGGMQFWSFVIGLTDCDKLHDLMVLLTKHKLDGLLAGQSTASQHASYQVLKSIIENQNGRPALRQWRLSLRAYLIVKLRNHGFPHTPVQGNFLVNLLDCSVSLAVIQLWLWLLLKEQKTISESELVNIIYKVERALVHNDTFYQQLNSNPQLLDMSEYLGCLADLG